MSISVPTSVQPSLRERVNVRILVFVSIFALLLGWPIYLFLDSTISGGLKNRGDYYEVDLKAMSDFSFPQNDGTLDDVPKKWRELDGKTIVMQGEVAPSTLRATGLDDQFQLVYSVAKCCYSGPPQIQHFVQVTVPRDASIDLGSGVVRVKGKLKVDVTRDPETGKINGVYHVVADGVTAV